MHLLDTTTKQLKTFYGRNIPKYAILSHMWGMEEDEVMFKHIVGSDDEKREGKIRRGYAKIEGACKQAIEDGWKYIWIDTCCIDKTSSAELSEAINSMYEWYRNSEVCYVYLEDVRSDGYLEPGSDKDDTFPIVSFERSRWFSRGWTLQELIAPQYVVFYSKHWVDIGTKTSLRDTISAVTRIRVEMLSAYDPKQASVAEKMSWAAFRKTTRAKDIAYCLMGLLGVNMPLLYGEGDRAFRRLQEEIMKISDDDSLFAWKDRLDNYNYLYNTQGMLADSPWDFRDGMNIIRSDSGAYSPYSMTNQGLQIKLPLLPIDSQPDLIGIDPKNIFKTILKCTIRNIKPTRWIVIYLKKAREGYYQRIFPHWLDESETNSNETNINGLTSLLVPQVHAPTISSRLVGITQIRVEILPTMSGFTVNGYSLVKGYECPLTAKDGIFSLSIYFSHPEKHFRVIIGSDNSIPWLEFIDITGYKNRPPYYDLCIQGDSRDREQHLDHLSMKIPGMHWWVTMSVKKTGRSQNETCLQALIDIQRIPIRAVGWYTPPLMTTNDSFDGDFPGNVEHHDIHPGSKKEGCSWFAMFNPKVKRVLDVGLVSILQPSNPSNNYHFLHKLTPLVFGEVNCIKFSSDGKYLATGSDIVRIYDTRTGDEIRTLINKSTTSDIYSIYFSPDSKLLATGDTDGCVKLWQIDTKYIQKVFNGHEDTVNFLCFSPDARLIISGSSDGIFRVWEIADGTSRILFKHNNKYRHNTSVTISPHSRLIAALEDDGIIQIWDMVTAQLLAELQEDYFVHVTFTPDGKGLVCGSADKALSYWDVSGLVLTNGKRNDEHSSVLTGRDIGKTTIFTGGHKDLIHSVAVSHDGHWVVSGSKDGSILFWDFSSATVQFMLKSQPVRSIDISPAGNIFATISKEDKMVRIWGYNLTSSTSDRSSTPEMAS